MAIVNTATLGPFLGENNRLPRHALQKKDVGSFIADSANIDIDVSGRISCASGNTLLHSLTTGRSGYSNGTFSLIADGTNLYSIVSFNPFSAVAVDTVASSSVAYTSINDEVYYSDGVKLMRLDNLGSVNKVGIPVPVFSEGTPTSGFLDPAWYQYTLTYFYDSEEGGAAASYNVELGASSGLVISIPSLPSGVTHVGVYFSGPNGEIPFLHSKVVAGTSSVTVTSVPTGRAVLTQFKGPMPSGSILASIPGYLGVASGNTFYYSEPYNFGMTNPAKNYIPFPATISVVVGCINGFYIVADKTYWVSGLGTDQFEANPVLPYGAVSGTRSFMPNDNKAFWLSNRGLVIGDSQGQVKNVQEENLLLNLSGSGASLFVEGNNRIVATNG